MEIKCQLDATEVFIADIIACSTCFGHHYAHHQELKSIIQWLLRVVFCAVVFLSSWSGVELRVMRPVCRTLVYSAIKTSVASSWYFISTHFIVLPYALRRDSIVLPSLGKIYETSSSNPGKDTALLAETICF